MQEIRLTENAARGLHNYLECLLKRETTSLDAELEHISIKAGDPSGQPTGWHEFEVTPVYKTKTMCDPSDENYTDSARDPESTEN